MFFDESVNVLIRQHDREERNARLTGAHMDPFLSLALPARASPKLQNRKTMHALTRVSPSVSPTRPCVSVATFPTVTIQEEMTMHKKGSGSSQPDRVLTLRITEESDPFFLYSLSVGEGEFQLLKNDLQS